MGELDRDKGSVQFKAIFGKGQTGQGLKVIFIYMQCMILLKLSHQNKKMPNVLCAVQAR